MDLSLFSVTVKNAGKKALTTELRLYFTTNADFRIGDIADVYATDRLMTDLGFNEDGDVVLTAPFHPAGPLTKLQQPGKGAVTNEDVDYLSITYTPVIGG